MATSNERDGQAPAGPLAGFKVLDLTRNVAGPMATYQLALLGAEVIRIEQPGQGDRMRFVGPSKHHNAEGLSTTYQSINGNKKSIALDLKSEAGRSVFETLVARADVLVESNRPGVMERLGLGADALRSRHPRLVYCAITGFGQTGPLRDVPSYDQMMQAVSGLMSVNGTPDTGPLRVGFPLIDTVTAVNAALGIAAALIERERTGVARFVDTSLLDSALSMMSPILGNVLIADSDVKAVGNEPFTGSPFSGVFRTRDGLIAVAGNTKGQCEQLCRLVGAEDLLDNPWIKEGGGVPRAEGTAAVRARMSEIYLTRTAAEWEALMQAHSVPLAKVRDLREILSHPQVMQGGFLAEMMDGVSGEPIRVPTSGFQLHGLPRERLRPAPRHAADTDEVLQAFGFDEAEIRRLRDSGAVQ
ncbi:MAG: CaiB/BaiF CoA transferase family protein [Burkholderiaceae bacterium]